jgi:hypothetical protein
VKAATLLCTGTLFVAGALSTGTAQDDPILPAVQSIIGRVFTGDSMALLQQLTDRTGPRLTGTPEYEDAATWAAEQFRTYGIQNVKLEGFTIPNGWRRGSARAEILSPIRRELQVASVSWAPSTPPSGASGEVILLSDLSPESVSAHAPAIRNHIVLIDTDKAFAAGFNQTYGNLQAAYRAFRDLGVPLLLLPDAVPNNVLGDWLDVDNGEAKIQPVPMAEIGMEDALLIRRLLAKGPVSLSADLRNTIIGPTTVHNVVAELPGSTHPDEWIVVGAHLDSWDLATGAQDNASGSVMVLEAARTIAALPQRPRRSIRFILWSGEEPGLMGSRTYVKQHATELDRCVAVLNTDWGVAHPKGWKVAGRTDLSEAMRAIESKYLAPLGASDMSLETTFDTDHGPFYLKGIPALDMWVDMTHYQDVHHKPSDTFDKIDALDLHAETAVMAVSAYIIADREEAIGAHISHDQVGEILRRANLTGYLTAHGDWQP